jgi:hypothetical protein
MKQLIWDFKILLKGNFKIICNHNFTLSLNSFMGVKQGISDEW